MLEMDYKLNIRLMNEMGLEEGDRRRVIDQDTEEVCCLGTKEIVTPGSQSGKNAVEFDPINNPRMMNKLFAEFIDKLAEEGSIDDSCISFGSYQDKNTKMNTARVLMSDGSVIESAPYKNESLCYMDLVLQLNGEEPEDLNPYDIDRTKKVTKMKAPTRKTMRSNNGKTAKKETV